ncbi:hypothetical protein FGO68_gene14152 [Halteria grandinella]|uniref:Calponin-homology (CH) domain-containing protein n=1 Tax=Halteria grandinella TaxID=5974 RepID=A0A8J8NWQ1_HALGN|nr:hypothetical protein FGO68_gene14152 [Halteria grandinella]
MKSSQQLNGLYFDCLKTLQLLITIIMKAPSIDEEELQLVYQWVDSVPLSRPKRNIARDFSDALLMAEIVHHFIPRLVDIHNYPGTGSVTQKEANWNTLNIKVFKKMGFQLHQDDIQSIVKCEQGAIEKVLRLVQLQITAYLSSPATKMIQSMTSGYTNQRPVVPPSHYKPIIKLGKNLEIVKQQNRTQQANNGIDYYEEVILSKDRQIEELKQTIEIMDLKIKKLEQLLSLKDSKIDALLSGKDQKLRK